MERVVGRNSSTGRGRASHAADASTFPPRSRLGGTLVLLVAVVSSAVVVIALSALAPQPSWIDSLRLRRKHNVPLYLSPSSSGSIFSPPRTPAAPTASAETVSAAPAAGTVPKYPSTRGKCRIIPPMLHAGFESDQMGMTVPRNISDTWQVSLCPSDETVLRGQFHVKRLRGCDLTTRFVEDPAIEEELRARFGPDELTLELEGPELVWMPQRHVGGCAYEFDYQVETPALYRLVAMSFREGFGSLNEMQGERYYFPPIRYDDIIGEWAWIDLKLYGGGDEGGDTGGGAGRGRPPCGRLDAPGRWVHRKVGAGVWLKAPLQHKPKPHGTNRKWLVDPREFRWQPYGCDAPEYPPERIGRCLSGRRVQFRGDSHTRVLMGHFAAAACGSPLSDMVPECLAPGSACRGALLCRSFDTVGAGEMEPGTQSVVGFGPESANFSGYRGWDTLVVNFGHHQSSSLWRMRQGEFRARVDAFVSALLEGQARHGFGVVFWSSVAAHTQRNPNVIQLRDWRTLHRIQSFNEYVEKRVRGTPIRFLDIHQVSASFRDALLCKDNAHYNDPYPQRAFSQLVLWALCDPPPLAGEDPAQRPSDGARGRT